MSEGHWLRLVNRLACGKNTEMKRPTLDDVARKSGVSKGTISAVINAKHWVRPQTREMVLDVMRSLNYRPRSLASNL
jgi:hypothetical protein